MWSALKVNVRRMYLKLEANHMTILLEETQCFPYIMSACVEQSKFHFFIKRTQNDWTWAAFNKSVCDCQVQQ